MRRRRRANGLRQTTTGLLLMAAGIVLLLIQQDVLEFGQIGHWWPLVLVVLGLWKMTAPPEERDPPGGAMLVVFGVWILACTHEWMGLTYRNSWPLILVAFGVKMVVRAMTPGRAAPDVADGKEIDHA